jgi:hypothetical protein
VTFHTSIAFRRIRFLGYFYSQKYAQKRIESGRCWCVKPHENGTKTDSCHGKAYP